MRQQVFRSRHLNIYQETKKRLWFSVLARIALSRSEDQRSEFNHSE